MPRTIADSLLRLYTRRYSRFSSLTPRIHPQSFQNRVYHDCWQPWNTCRNCEAVTASGRGPPGRRGRGELQALSNSRELT